MTGDLNQDDSDIVVSARRRGEPSVKSVPDPRSTQMWEMRWDGATLQEIANEFGVTRERVRQILMKVGGPTSSEVRQRQRSAAKRADGLKSARIASILRARPGQTASEVADQLGIKVDEIRRLTPADCKAFLIWEGPDAAVTWSDSEIIKGLQRAATFEYPLAGSTYDELLKVGEIAGPSAVRLGQRFGSWRAACEFAGVEPHPAWANYQSTWTDTDALAFALEYLTDRDYSGAFHRYDTWRAEKRPSAPSGGILRSRFGGWREVKRRAFATMTSENPRDGHGAESHRLDAELASKISASDREKLWHSVGEILRHGPLGGDLEAGNKTVLALGYVQSGKTTSITALAAAAADHGYRLIVAMLGSTNLLLEQNRGRLETAIGISGSTRSDYVWVSEPNLAGSAGTQSMTQHLDRGRAIFVPVLKHSGRITDVAKVLASLDLEAIPALIIDDEADQASLNTGGSGEESKTYSAIRALRDSLPHHLYVQYTATPYAPLLLDSDNLLKPDQVEFLEPGTGYVGGREFFVDHERDVVRDVPLLDEQAGKASPLSLPASLTTALAAFISGAAVLLGTDPGAAPVSMLVHSTARNDVQQRYHFLVKRQLAAWRGVLDAAQSIDDLPGAIQSEYGAFVARGGQDLGDSLIPQLVMVLRETTLWLVNSTSALNRVSWGVSRCHVLIGGNKLDRGFTVEGLTVTYMNRPSSPQVDTLEQRARAFGYRGDQLPFCQFFASKKTIRSLRDIVFTEYDLRARLRDEIDRGGTVSSWAENIGLLLPDKMKPTRDTVVTALSRLPFGWHSLRRPSFAKHDLVTNRAIVENIGLFEAPFVDYGRRSHRTLEIPLREVLDRILRNWATESYSPTWRHQDIIAALERHPDQDHLVPVLLLEESGSPRKRKWDDEIGFVNLFQGRDASYPADMAAYPGDAAIPSIDVHPDNVVLQVHRVVKRGAETPEVLTLAVYLGTRQIITKNSEGNELD